MGALDNTRGLAICKTVELDRFMQMLEEHLTIPVETRLKRQELMRTLTTFQRTDLAIAKDNLDIEESRLMMLMNDEVDDKGKPRWSNPELRKARMTQLMASDPEYKTARTALRQAEIEEARLKTEIAQLDEDLKVAAEMVWGYRELLRGAAAAVMAVSTFDGPKLPAEIPLTVQGTLPQEIMLRLQGTLPDQIHVTTDPLTVTQAAPLTATVTQTEPLRIAAITTPEKPKEAAA